MKPIFRNLITLGLITAVLYIAAVLTKNRESTLSQTEQEEFGKIEIVNAPPIEWEVAKLAYDGDTITVTRNGEKLKVRFACIDAPELKQPMGKASRDYLRSLISKSNNKVGLNIITTDRYKRSVAEVWINSESGIELVQSLMVVTGNAYPYERYKNDCPSWNAVKISHEYAENNNIGVWSGNYQPPWEYRKTKKR